MFKIYERQQTKDKLEAEKRLQQIWQMVNIFTK